MDFTINELNVNGDIYTRRSPNKYQFDTSEIIDLIDLITWNDVQITKVTRNSDNVVFCLDDQIDINEDDFDTIELFYIQNGVFRISMEDGNDIPLSTAVKYVEEDNTGFDNIQQTIESNNTRQVRVIGVLKNRRETLKEFLVRFFTEFNTEKDTIYVDTRDVQTYAGKRRSLGDIYMICKYYFPTVTLKEVIQLLYVDLFSEIDPGFRSSYCTTINKRVWYYSPNSANEMLNKTQNDEFGKAHRFYISNLD